nr:MAG TPA: hypothetical protein [Caudoviricetes sp.]
MPAKALPLLPLQWPPDESGLSASRDAVFRLFRPRKRFAPVRFQSS